VPEWQTTLYQGFSGARSWSSHFFVKPADTIRQRRGEKQSLEDGGLNPSQGMRLAPKSHDLL